MAIIPKLASSSSSSSSSSSDRISPRTLHLFLFFSLLFVLSAFANSSGEFSKPSVSDMAVVTRRTLFTAAYADEKDDVAAQKVGFYPGKKAYHDPNAKSKQGQFGASKHEVPSGPNPISNK